jgi:putative transcriptional regulator
MLADRKMSSKELADIIGTTQVNLSRIKTGQIRGIRFSTLYEICKALNCQPGDLLECVIDDADEERSTRKA